MMAKMKMIKNNFSVDGIVAAKFEEPGIYLVEEVFEMPDQPVYALYIKYGDKNDTIHSLTIGDKAMFEKFKALVEREDPPEKIEDHSRQSLSPDLQDLILKTIAVSQKPNVIKDIIAR